LSTEATKERILAAARRERAPTRAAAIARSVVGVGLSVAAMLAVFLAAGGPRPSHALDPVARPHDLVLETAVGAAVIAALAVAVLAARGRSTLGRGRRVLAVFIVAVPLLLLGWKVAWTALHTGMMAPWPKRIGLRCLGLSLSMGLGPPVALALVRRDGDPLHPVLTGAALGIAAGAWAWVLLDLWCPIAYLPHLVLGHVLPMALLAAFGALLGWRWIAMRER
jgi:hypothetical protein